MLYKVKRLLLIAVLLLQGAAALAQKENVDAAFSALVDENNAAKAVEFIEKACKHSDTKGGAWTWCVASYAYGNLIIAEPFDKRHIERTLECMRMCRKLDALGEYDTVLSTPYSMVGTAYYIEAVRLGNAGHYEAADVYYKRALEYHTAADDDQLILSDSWSSFINNHNRYYHLAADDIKTVGKGILDDAFENLRRCDELLMLYGDQIEDMGLAFNYDDFDSAYYYLCQSYYGGASLLYEQEDYAAAKEWLYSALACVPADDLLNGKPIENELNEAIAYCDEALRTVKQAPEAQAPAPQQPSQGADRPTTSSAPRGVDVDDDIPVASAANGNTYVFIIANEDYPGRHVPYALNDGRIFKEYCNRTMGIPLNHIKIYENASGNNIIGCIAAIRRASEANDGDLNVIFYYAGHAFPDERTKDAYLLPVDGDHELVETCYSLKRLYEELGKIKTKACVCFLDACFSGATRDDAMLLEGRGVAIKPKEEMPKGNLVVLTSASGVETALQYEEKHHGLFTYYLLKKMQETNGNLTLGDLYDAVYKNVKRTSYDVNGKIQTPSVLPSATMGQRWRSIKL